MALWHWVLFWILAPSAALALDLRPAEPPPADFPARQYIDSRGCVFLRDDDGVWTARLARDGTPICGYPPSLSQRGLEGRPRLRALDPDAGKTRAELASRALELVVTTGLRDGELASDPRPMETLPDMGPEPHSSAPMDDLKAALRAAPAVRQGMSRDLQPNRRLCELLGYDGKVVAGKAGQDPTKGYCGSLPDTDLSRLAFERPLEGQAGAAKPDEVVTPVAAPPRAPAKTQPVRTTEVKAKPRPAKPAAPGIGMIPPGARYVQIGSYGAAANADRAAQRAAGLGYPVLRGKDRGKAGQVHILAGPFDSRETIVRALDSLRKAGFRDAYPR